MELVGVGRVVVIQVSTQNSRLPMRVVLRVLGFVSCNIPYPGIPRYEYSFTSICSVMLVRFDVKTNQHHIGVRRYYSGRGERSVSFVRCLEAWLFPGYVHV